MARFSWWQFLSRPLLVLGLGGSIPAASHAQAPALTWQRAIGGSSADALATVLPAPGGGYLLAGTSRSPVGGDRTGPVRGGDDYWVVKLSAAGAVEWNRSYGAQSADILVAAQATSDGGYILGGYSQSGVFGDRTVANRGGEDYWVVKIDAQGTKQWDNAFGGGGNDRLQSVVQTSDGGYLLGGFSNSPISGDKTDGNRGVANTYDYWVVKLDAQGSKQWEKTLGGADNDLLYAVVQTADGGFVLGGWSISGISGERTQAGYGAADYWLVKLDATGQQVWDKTYGGSSADLLYCLRQTPDNGFLLVGESISPASGLKSQPSDNKDFWVVKLDAQGNKQWDQTTGGNGDDQPAAVQLTPDGGYLIAGKTTSPSGVVKTTPLQGGTDYWLVKLSATGQLQWETGAGGWQDDVPSSLLPTADGGYLLGGTSASGATGDKTQPSQGGTDYWVVKFGGQPMANRTATGQKAMEVYPNPTRGAVTLWLPPEVLSAETRLTLLDLAGHVVQTQILPATRSTSTPVLLGKHQAGLYLLRLDGPGGYRAAQRLVFE